VSEYQNNVNKLVECSLWVTLTKLRLIASGGIIYMMNILNFFLAQLSKSVNFFFYFRCTLKEKLKVTVAKER